MTGVALIAAVSSDRLNSPPWPIPSHYCPITSRRPHPRTCPPPVVAYLFRPPRSAGHRISTPYRHGATQQKTPAGPGFYATCFGFSRMKNQNGMSSSKLSKLPLAAGAGADRGADAPPPEEDLSTTSKLPAPPDLLPSICISLTMISVV
jgi:hypothetical protein